MKTKSNGSTMNYLKMQLSKKIKKEGVIIIQLIHALFLNFSRRENDLKFTANSVELHVIINLYMHVYLFINFHYN